MDWAMMVLLAVVVAFGAYLVVLLDVSVARPLHSLRDPLPDMLRSIFDVFPDDYRRIQSRGRASAALICQLHRKVLLHEVVALGWRLPKQSWLDRLMEVTDDIGVGFGKLVGWDK